MKEKKCLKCETMYDKSLTNCPNCNSTEFKLLGDGLQEADPALATKGSFIMGFIVGLNPFGGLLAALAFGQRRTAIGGVCAFILRLILLALIIWLIVFLVNKYN